MAEANRPGSFCYVSDLVEGIVRLLKTDFARSPQIWETPTRSTVMQLAEEIIALVGDTKSKIIYEDLPEDDPKGAQARHHARQEAA